MAAVENLILMPSDRFPSLDTVLSNGDFEVDTSGWGTTGTGGSIARTAGGFSGQYAGQVTGENGVGAQTAALSVTAGTSYTATLMFQAPNTSWEFKLSGYQSDGVTFVSSTVVGVTGVLGRWVRVEVTHEMGMAVNVRLAVRRPVGSGLDTCLIDVVQIRPGSGSISLNGDTWGLEQLDLGTPNERDELVSSADTDGAMPFRVAKREPVEWSARIRLVSPAASKDEVLEKLRVLEAALTDAQRVAADGITDPGVDPVRLVWSPAGSTVEGVLPLTRAEIRSVPKVVQGDDAGWFLEMPVIEIGGLRDPFVYGPLAQVTQGSVTGSPLGQTLDVPPVGGAVAPWVKVVLAETGSVDRNLITAGLVLETQPLVFPADTGLSVTGLSGTKSAGRITVTSTEWVGAAKVSGVHRGQYRVVACLTKGGGAIRFRWGNTGQAQTLNVQQTPDYYTFVDLDLGAIDVDRDAGGTWTGIIETTGTVSLAGLVLVPMNCWVSAVTPPGSAALGTKVVDGNLTGTGALNGSALTLPAGQTWTATGTWTKASGYVERTAVSEGSIQTALAGSSTYAGVKVALDVYSFGSGYTWDLYRALTTGTGGILRYASATRFVVFGAVGYAPVIGPGARYLAAYMYIDGTETILFHDYASSRVGWLPENQWHTVSMSVDTQGRWELSYGDRLIAGGQHPALAAGGLLASGKVGLFDRRSESAANIRRLRNFKVYGSPLSATPILPSGKSVELTPAGMVTVDGANRTRISHRGGVIAPPPDRTTRLLVAPRRFTGMASTEAEGKTDNQTVTVLARKRWLQIP